MKSKSSAVPIGTQRDTPGPVRDAATTVQQSVQPLAAKRPGEAITSADWNALAGSVGALAEAVSQLTRLVILAQRASRKNTGGRSGSSFIWWDRH